MKAAIAIIICLSLFTTSVRVFATHKEKPVQLITQKGNNLFAFKVSKPWQYAHVEVLAVNGDCVSCQTLMRRKMVINFQDVKAGTYTIKISKGEYVQEFEYVKK